MTDAEAAGRPATNIRLLEQVAQGYRPYLLLTLFCALMFLPGLGSLPPLDRDESRFAQATAQMLETGDFIDIRFQDQPRHKKPAGIHWLQAASVSLFSDPGAREIWAYRLPSVIGAWAAVLFTFAAGAALFGQPAGLLAGGMMAASVMLILEAHQAKTDAVLLAAVMAQQFVLARHYLAARSGGQPPGLGLAVVFWLAMGTGVMIKGPIAPLITLMTIAALVIADRDARWLRRLGWLWGLPLACALALPWYIAIGDRTGGDGDGFVMTALTTDLIPKLLGGQESHGAPPGYYALLMIFFFWPGSLFAWPALVRAWRARQETAIRFCLAWMLPAWLMFELIPTKLPHYVLPLYPALALMTAAALVTILKHERPWFGRKTLVAAIGLWTFIALTLGGAAAYLPIHFGAEVDWPTALFVLLPIATTAAVIQAMRRRAGVNLVARSVIGGGALVILVIGVMITGFQPMWAGRDAARAVHAAFPDGPPGITASAGYSEPSLVFLLGTRTKLTAGPGAAGHVLSQANAAAIVESRQLSAFKKALGDRAGQVREIARAAGVNYSKGDDIVLHVFVRRDGP